MIKKLNQIRELLKKQREIENLREQECEESHILLNQLIDEGLFILRQNNEMLQWNLMDSQNSLKWEAIILHHSLTNDGKIVDWRNIRRYHIQTNGWTDIGYHLGVERINGELVIQYGRGLNKVGAHCREYQMNIKGIGLCLIGNYDIIPPDKEQWDLLLAICHKLQKKFNIPTADIKGHREFATYKTCPGTQFNLNKFREDLSNGA